MRGAVDRTDPSMMSNDVSAAVGACRRGASAHSARWRSGRPGIRWRVTSGVLCCSTVSRSGSVIAWWFPAPPADALRPSAAGPRRRVRRGALLRSPTRRRNRFTGGRLRGVRDGVVPCPSASGSDERCCRADRTPASSACRGRARRAGGAAAARPRRSERGTVIRSTETTPEGSSLDFGPPAEWRSRLRGPATRRARACTGPMLRRSAVPFRTYSHCRRVRSRFTCSYRSGRARFGRKTKQPRSPGLRLGRAEQAATSGIDSFPPPAPERPDRPDTLAA